MQMIADCAAAIATRRQAVPASGPRQWLVLVASACGAAPPAARTDNPSAPRPLILRSIHRPNRGRGELGAALWHHRAGGQCALWIKGTVQVCFTVALLRASPFACTTGPLARKRANRVGKVAFCNSTIQVFAGTSRGACLILVGCDRVGTGFRYRAGGFSLKVDNTG